MRDELALQILAELVRIRQALEGRAHPPADAAAAAFLRAVHAAVGGRVFTAGDLVEHAALPGATALAEAILAVCRGKGARPLGRALRRFEGAPAGGFSLERVGIDRDGALWRVNVVTVTTFTALPVAPAGTLVASSGLDRSPGHR